MYIIPKKYDNKTASIIQDSITGTCNIPVEVGIDGSDGLTLSLFGEKIGTYSDVNDLIHDAVVLSRGYSVGMEKAKGQKEPKEETSEKDRDFQGAINYFKQKREYFQNAAENFASMGDTDLVGQWIKEADKCTSEILRLENEQKHPKEQPAVKEEEEEVFYSMDFPFNNL